ncbi:MAG: AAA family ATPase [Dethiobacteria bacterium]|jgi:MoxR-like ATPase|nr:MoxR family ATPase [Bacillota bacterium]
MDFAPCKKIVDNIARVVVGKSEAVKLLIVALLAEGHVLLEDVPGVGKTLLAKTLARSTGGSFKRVQFTPDLLPADITGFNIYNQQSGEFKFQPGPVSANILLADEINRTIPRTQASLLEAMEERQVTVDGITRALPEPFLVIATQNPIELEGTFPLPEAQLDRFLLRISLGYPSKEEEDLIISRFQETNPLEDLQPVISPAEVVNLQKQRRTIKISPAIREYIVKIVDATRRSPLLRFGASPRGSLSLMRAAQAMAAFENRDYVLPDDLKAIIKPVLAHRLILKPEEKMRGTTAEDILEEIIAQVEVPTPGVNE